MSREILKELLKRGMMPTNQALEEIKKIGLEKFLSKTENQKTIIEKAINEEKTNLRITSPEKKKKLKPQDVISFYHNRYEGLRKILLKKISPISISNIKQHQEVSVIGMVTELHTDGFLIEDMTGKIKVASNSRLVALDDVVGIKGVISDGSIKETELFFPEVPLKTKQKRLVGYKIQVAFDAGKLNVSDGKEKAESNKNPVWITVGSDEKAEILFYNPERDIDMNHAKNFLRKRHLYPLKSQLIGPKDPFIIKKVPDYFLFLGKPGTDIYKGITIISFSKKAEIDLERGSVKTE